MLSNKTAIQKVEKINLSNIKLDNVKLLKEIVSNSEKLTGLNQL